MRTTKELLYEKVSSAREACGGDCPLKKHALLKKVDGAIAFAQKVNAEFNILNKLSEARRIIAKSKTYAERLPADQLLCEILNVDLGER